ncbi:hypothetical protein [Pseudoalteromonas aurantia]|uniref:Uncharacterized protein n=1 Tax=Pseudoalteromonas aurantia TaxID=43654 RepID=A0A5S3V036_9GAMM|nr:hypothetical protein [Pseudoalteromonas aurantia]TMO60333.1 hypothetical protein CWC18_13835 [Pseudoalteromonas aurantia]TMO63760.1 hypothetical protein CWC19_18960 [Pseudoalteromonas aurantia]TMO73699.1 hypothetical protein CWC20_12615 [Pseudoalteromonas aurantia]
MSAKCEDKAYREFDFWLADWQVYTPDDKLAGRNFITADHNNCVIKERYTSVSGYQSERLGIYDITMKLWHQT